MEDPAASDGPRSGAELPRPFYDQPWPGHSRAAAKAFWHWHLALAEPPPGKLRLLDSSQQIHRVLDGQPIDWVSDAVSAAAYEACAAHSLQRRDLASQLEAAPKLWGPLRLADQAELDRFVDSWAVAHARLLARLGDAAHSWQLPFVSEFSRGLFLVGRLMRLPRDVTNGRVFVPVSDLEQAGVSVEDLLLGRRSEPVRRLLWKQVVRARDALAHGAPLVNEVSPRFARALRLWWMAGVEVLNEIERRDYDLWTAPIKLSLRHRIQVRFQARFGRTTFRGR